MSEEWLPLILCTPFVLLIMASGLWANRRFRRFKRLPGHFDITGKATYLAPRSLIIWYIPIVLSTVLIAIALAGVLVPRELQNGDAVTGVVLGGVCILGAQMLILWLTERWASRQN